MSDWLESRSPAFIAAAIGMLAGLCLFGYGLYGLFAVPDFSGPLGFSLLIGGALDWLFCFTAVRRVRVGWAFAVSFNGVACAVFFFGAPKVRDGLDTNLGVGLLPAIAFLTITILFAISSAEYRGQTPPS